MISRNPHDHAVEESIKSVQLNSDTIETYAAPGNLCRSKGHIERAIRIRQTIILRPDINEQIKFRAFAETSAEETGEEA